MADAKKGKLNARRITAELRKLTIADLEKKLAEEREKLMRDRFRHATAALEDTAELKTTRQQIARIATVIKQKKLAEAKKDLAASGVAKAGQKLIDQDHLSPSRKNIDTVKEEVEGALA